MEKAANLKLIKVIIEGFPPPKVKKINLNASLASVRKDQSEIIKDDINFVHEGVAIDLSDEDSMLLEELLTNGGKELLLRKVQQLQSLQQSLQVDVNNGTNILTIIFNSENSLAQLREDVRRRIEGQFSFLFEKDIVDESDESGITVQDVSSNQVVYITCENYNSTTTETTKETCSATQKQPQQEGPIPQQASIELSNSNNISQTQESPRDLTKELIYAIYAKIIGKSLVIRSGEKIIRGSTADQMLTELDKTKILQLTWSNSSIFDLLEEGLILNLNTYQGFSGVLSTLNTRFQGMRRQQEFKDDLFLKNSPYSEQLYYIACLLTNNFVIKSELNRIYSVYDPIPLYYPNFDGDYENLIFNQEYFWAIQPSYLCIQLPYGDGASQQIGKTSLMNDLFQIPLQSKYVANPISRRTISIYTYQSIQPSDQKIPMSDFKKEMSWSFIDIPGALKAYQYQKILKLSKNFIIHSHFQDLANDVSQFIQYVRNILEISGYALVILLHQCPDGFYEEGDFQKDYNYYSLYKTLKQAFSQVFIIPVLKDNGIVEVGTIKHQFISTLFEYPKSCGYQYDLNGSSFIKLCDKSLIDIFQLVSNFIALLNESVSSKQSSEFSYLSYYPTYIKKQKLEEVTFILQSQLMNDKLQKDIQILREEINKCQEILESQKISQLLISFLKIFASEQRNVLLGELQKQLKTFSAANAQYSNDQLSVELLMREMWLTNQYQPEQVREIIDLRQAFVDFVTSGQPFELIDGDNNVSLIKYYSEYLSGLQNLQTCYVCILGPQSSGKSTLLKFGFGCHFQTSSGRCTRGVYGSLQKLDSQIGLNPYKYILIIDTEGVDSSERKEMFTARYNQLILDKYGVNVKLDDALFKRGINFDVLMTLFCFQISETVILNVKGEGFDTYMKGLLTVAIRGIIMLKMNNLKSPDIVLSMNQNSSTSLENIKPSLNKLMTEIQDLEEIRTLLSEETKDTDSDIQSVISFSADNIITLPTAFKSDKVFDQNNFPGIKYRCESIKPDEQFGYQTLKFRDLVLKLIKMRCTSSTPKLFGDWLDLCDNLWERIYNEKELLKFTNASEIKEQKKLQSFEKEFLRKDGIYEAHQKEALDCLNSAINSYKIQQSSDKSQLEFTLKRDLHIIYDKLQATFTKNLKDLTEEQKLHIEYLIDDTKARIMKRIALDRNHKMSQLLQSINMEKSKDLVEKTSGAIKNELHRIVKENSVDTLDINKAFQSVYDTYFVSLIKDNQAGEQQMQDCFKSVYDMVATEQKNFVDCNLLNIFNQKAHKMRLQQWYSEELTECNNFLLQAPINMLQVSLSVSFSLDDTLTSLFPYNQAEEFTYFALNKYFRANEGFMHGVKKVFGAADKYEMNPQNPQTYHQYFKFLLSGLTERRKMEQAQNFDCVKSTLIFLKNSISFKSFLERIDNCIQKIEDINQGEIGKKITEINQIIALLEHELKQVDTKLTNFAVKKIYNLPIILWTAKLFDKLESEQRQIEEKMAEQKQMLFQQFKDQVQNLKNFNALSMSGQLDTDSATKFSERCVKKIQNLLKDQQIDQFKSVFSCDLIQNQFTPQYVKDFIKYLQKQGESGEALYEFMKRPQQSIYKRIEGMVNEKQKQISSNVIQQYQESLTESIQELITLFSKIRDNISENKCERTCNCLLISEITDSSSKSIPELFSHILREYLNQRLDDFIAVGDQQINISNLFQQGFPSFRAALKINSGVAQQISDALNGGDIMIFNLYSFLEKAIENLSQYLNQSHSASSIQSAISKEVLNEINRISNGCRLCGTPCPSCKRGCDQDQNHSSGIKHRCSAGHFFMAFQGWHYESTMKACLISCDLMNQKDLNLQWKDKTIRFSEWKRNYAEWDFSTSQAECRDNYQMMQRVWTQNNGYIGRKVCTENGIVYSEEFDQDVN